MKRTLLLALILISCGRAATIDSPDPHPSTGQPLRGCDGQAVVMLESHRTLTRVSATGSTKLFTFGEGLADEDASVSQWDSSHGFVGGIAFIGTGGPNDYTYEYVLLGRSEEHTSE